MTLNIERLRTLAAEARAALNTLDSFTALTRAEFLADRAAIERVRYNFIVALQACIDICNHIAARKGRRAPSNYADCFKVLEEIGILDGALCSDMQRLAGLRNAPCALILASE